MKPPYLLMAALLTAAASLPVFAAGEAMPEKTTAQDVRKEAHETVDAIASYSVEKKDEALKKAKDVLEAFDARMDKLEKNAREQLKKERQAAAVRYKNLQRATKKTWEVVRDRFVESYRGLEQEFERVENKKSK